MAENKKSFLLYCDLINTVEKLNDEQAGKLLKHILRYVNDKNPKPENQLLDLVFEPIKLQLKRDLKRYETIRNKRSLAGKVSAEKRKQKSTNVEFVKSCSTNSTDTIVTVTDTDTDTVSDSVIDIINKTLMSEIKISDLEKFKKEEVEFFNIAEKFRLLFIKNQKERNAPTKNQEKAKYSNYVNPIRLIFEQDKGKKEQLIQVYQFLDSSIGDFWKPNILSTKKLRQKMPQLVMKANEKQKGVPQTTIGDDNR